MADVDNLVKGGVDLGKGAVAEHAGHGRKSLNLEEGLNLVLGVAVRAVANAETIVSQSGVAEVVHGVSDI